MKKIIIKNGTIINEGKIFQSDLMIEGRYITRIDKDISYDNARIIDAEGKIIIPGIIDDQVHFREPGMEYKGNIHTESRAAALGGITSYMDMPNNKPAILTQQLLDYKYEIANKSSYTNYSFYMGASNENIEELKKTDPTDVCGIKIFMGSSTGNMLVDDHNVLEKIFRDCNILIATHCEDETTIKKNFDKYCNNPNIEPDPSIHPKVRNDEACYLSSSFAVSLANQFNTRLHVLHLSSANEMELFDNKIALRDKRITSEVCVHHLKFSDHDYLTLGNKIKCNPAIKTQNDRQALWEALLNDRLDIIATDHAPHTLEEKQKKYLEAPSGLPLVQHSLNIMLNFFAQGKISLEKIVSKMCHNPATVFNIINRGFLREGYFADICILDLKKKWAVDTSNIHYHCGWSPLENVEFVGKIETVFVNGTLVVQNGRLTEQTDAMRLKFDR